MYSQVHLLLGKSAKRTVIESLYYSPPMRPVDVGHIEKYSNPLYLMLTSSSPGMLDDDKYEIILEQADNTALKLSSQAYQHLMNTDKTCSQEMYVYLGENSVLSYIPYPIVAHKNAKFSGNSVLEIQDSSQLLWGEIMSMGRKHMGELFEFDFLRSNLEIYINKRIAFKDLLYFDRKMDLQVLGFFEGYSHCGMLLVFLQDKQVLFELREFLTAYQAKHLATEIVVSCSEWHSKGVVVRALAQGGETISQLFQEIGDLLWEYIGAKTTAFG